MPDISANKLTKEQFAELMDCETAEKLMTAAKAYGLELTHDEADAFIEKFADLELDEATLKNVAGGSMDDFANDLGKLFKLLGGIAQVLSPTVTPAGNDPLR